MSGTSAAESLGSRQHSAQVTANAKTLHDQITTRWQSNTTHPHIPRKSTRGNALRDHRVRCCNKSSAGHDIILLDRLRFQKLRFGAEVRHHIDDVRGNLFDVGGFRKEEDAV